MYRGGGPRLPPPVGGLGLVGGGAKSPAPNGGLGLAVGILSVTPTVPLLTPGLAASSES